jgi:hypothetical protein
MIPERYRATCHYGCGLELDVRSPRVAQRIQGWGMNRARGVNAVRLQERLPQWACKDCIERACQGISPDQGALL